MTTNCYQGKYEAEKPSGLPEKFPSASNNNQIKLNEIDENKIPGSSITESATSYTAILDDSTMEFRRVQTEAPEVVQYSSSHAGLIIGILLTIISLLIGAILYVVYQVRFSMKSKLTEEILLLLIDKKSSFSPVPGETEVKQARRVHAPVPHRRCHH